MQAARLSGSGTAGLLLRHTPPNILGPILVTAVLDIGTMMMELAALGSSWAWGPGRLSPSGAA